MAAMTTQKDKYITTVFHRGTAHTCIIAHPQTLENLDIFALFIYYMFVQQPNPQLLKIPINHPWALRWRNMVYALGLFLNEYI